MTQPHLQADMVYWQDIKHQASNVNPEFSQLIDQLSPGNDLPLLKLTLPYGFTLFDQGQEQFSNAQYTLHTDTQVDLNEQWPELFNYCSLPLGLCLGGVYEVFVDLGKRIIPQTTINPGKFLGLFETLSTKTDEKRSPPWSITSGVRSTFVLSPISQLVNHQRLQRQIGINTPLPKTMYEHWFVFRDLMQHTDCHWRSELILFTRPWYERIFNQADGISLQQYLCAEYWHRTQSYRIENDITKAWSILGQMMMKNQQDISQHQHFLIKQLLMIMMGGAPGFVPTQPDDNDLPCQLLQQLFSDIYKLNYAPIIMQPAYLTADQPRTVYHSINLPTKAEIDPQYLTIRNKSAEIAKTKTLLDNFFADISHHDHVFADLVQSINLDCYLSDVKQHQRCVLPSSSIVDNDRFMLEACKNLGDRPFNHNSSFLNGCFALSQA